MSGRPYIHSEEEDAQLAAVARGDKFAFEQLYDRYAGGLEKYIYFITRSKEVTEEIIQDVFIRIWQKREQLPELDSFRAYLFRIARNQVISWLRSARPRHKIVELDESLAGGSRADADHLVLYNQYYKMVLDAIALLPERKKEVFLLSLEEDLTLDEIARRLHLTKSTVKQHLYSATTSIRDYLKKYGNVSSALIIFLTLFES